MGGPRAASTLPPRALSLAERTCAEAGGKLTAPRREVLSLLLEADQPLAAYDLIERMQALRGQTYPPTVYRALEFLERAGLVHRISSRKAYVACRGTEPHHRPIFLVCRECNAATEVTARETETLLQTLAQNAGFESEQIVQEVQGRCRACVEAACETA
ncbi:MAG: transcriptional repressor [Caulobacteraceae bacterium]|nr:transcriptional repressor [Caulobacteraceae bacterium]